MIEKYIIPGGKLELQASKRAALSGSGREKTYTTKIHDIISDDRVEVVMPMEQTKLILLPVDGEYEMYFYAEGGLYQCVGKVIDRYKNNNVYILLFELRTNLRKYQRREYYRYSCALDMEARNISEEELVNGEEQTEENVSLMPGLPLKRSIVVDISGGGLRFVSDYKYEKGSSILCKYRLIVKGVLREYEIVSEILDVRELENKKGSYEHRVRYVNLDSKDREDIIQFIFDEERRKRQRERGF